MEHAVVELREGPGARLADHRHERGVGHVAPRRRRRSSRAPTSYALLFGAWAAITELIPYLGPWLGAMPPCIYALVVHPVSAIWVVAPVPLHPPDRGARRRSERDGRRAAAAPAARDLRPARGRRDLRLRRACSSRCRCSPRARGLGVLLRAGRARAVGGAAAPVPVEVEVEPPPSAAAGACRRRAPAARPAEPSKRCPPRTLRP